MQADAYATVMAHTVLLSGLGLEVTETITILSNVNAHNKHGDNNIYRLSALVEV
jgi:hypothetical protein